MKGLNVYGSETMEENAATMHVHTVFLSVTDIEKTVSDCSVCLSFDA